MDQEARTKYPNVKRKKIDLLPCPFCGSEATFQSVNAYMHPAVYVRCLNCRTRTDLFVTGYDPVNERVVTETEIALRASKIWNSRRATV